MVPLILPCATTGLASIAAWCGSGTTPSGLAVVTCLNATARTRWAERAVQSDVFVRVANPPWDAQRTAHFCATRYPIWRPLHQQLIHKQ